MARTLVLNATGKVSTALIDELVDKGIAVTAASRNPTAPSTDAVRRVHFDYDDPETFGTALEGVDRVFWLAPPMQLDVEALCGPFFDAALPVVDKVVLMTASGVEHAGDIPLRRIEKRIEAAPVDHTILRPNWFMDNFHTFWVYGVQNGTIELPAADGKSAFIDAGDIAASAAAALTRPETSGRAYTLTGSESFTYAEAAEVLGHAAGHPVRYEAIEDDAFIEAMSGAGLPRDYAGFLAGLFAAVRAGGAAEVSGAVEELTGRPPRTLADYADAHAADFRA